MNSEGSLDALELLLFNELPVFLRTFLFTLFVALPGVEAQFTNFIALSRLLEYF